MVASLQQALTNTTKHHKGRPIQPIVWTRHNAFVDRWIDYTAKYGLGYSISGGDMAVLFNDATTLSTVDQK
jgi:polo-like kinase 1